MAYYIFWFIVVILFTVSDGTTPQPPDYSRCVHVWPLFIASNSTPFRRQLNHTLAPWTSAACVEEVLFAIPNAITIQHVINNVDRVQYEPFRRLFISVRPQNKVNISEALAKLFDVDLVRELALQQQLLRHAAFKYAPDIPSVWQPLEPFNTSRLLLVKRNITLGLTSGTCQDRQLAPLNIPIPLPNTRSTPSIASDLKRQVIVFPNTHTLWLSPTIDNPTAQYISLQFAVRAIAKYQRYYVLLLDMFHNLHIAPTNNVSNTTLIHSFREPVKALFSTLNGDALVIQREGGVRRIKLTTTANGNSIVLKTLENAAQQYSCLLEFFNHAPHHYLPYDDDDDGDNGGDDTTAIADHEVINTLRAQTTNTYAALNTLLSILKRVHPELLLICVTVLVPLMLIALPLLAILSVYALRLYAKIQSFSLDDILPSS